MKYINTKDHSEEVSFSEATIKGLASQKGLFVPKEIPQLSSDFIKSLPDKSNQEIAFEVLFPFVKDVIGKDDLKALVNDALDFEIPAVRVDEDIYSLELFHGPTLAFKDVGARFMARFLNHFLSNEKKVTVLAATSGDTGSAVANGFWKVKGVDVIVLFPKGGVSKFQEQQMTTLGENITAIEIEGSFDDCQNLVKAAFADEELNKELNLTSANSINMARLLPQAIYYFIVYKQLAHLNKKLVVSVPSGNLGNLTAGLIAKKMGLPIEQFVAATNANDAFTKYLDSGDYQPKDTIQTLSNAMDVGNPSNFERIKHFYSDLFEQLNEEVKSLSYTDDQTLKAIKDLVKKSDYLMDPHGAVAYLGLKDSLNGSEKVGVFLETAHPKKFEKAVQKALPNVSFEYDEEKPSFKESLGKEFESFKDFLNKRAVLI